MIEAGDLKPTPDGNLLKSELEAYISCHTLADIPILDDLDTVSDLGTFLYTTRYDPDVIHTFSNNVDYNKEIPTNDIRSLGYTPLAELIDITGSTVPEVAAAALLQAYPDFAVKFDTAWLYQGVHWIHSVTRRER